MDFARIKKIFSSKRLASWHGLVGGIPAHTWQID
jgi:hypothetical protein